MGIHTHGGYPWQKYERVPSRGYEGAVKSPYWPTKSTAPFFENGCKMRGSGMWGPEETAVMRLTLASRVKMARKQRAMPTLQDEQQHWELGTSIAGWVSVFTFMWMPMFWWVK